MNRLIFTVIVSLSAWTVQAQTVEEIINHHLDAMGGVANLRAINMVKGNNSIIDYPVD